MLEPMETACIQGLTMTQTVERIAKLRNYQQTIRSTLKSLTDDSIQKRKLHSELRDTGTAIAFHEAVLDKCNDYPKWLREVSELGQRFMDRTFANTDSGMDSKALKTCKAYADRFDRIRNEEKNGLILSGSWGVGKTHLVASIGNYLIDNKSVPVLFANVPSMLEKIKSEFNDKDFTKANAMRVPLLILDDLGKERRTSWTDQMLYEIINHRYESKLPVLVTTNLSGTEMVSKLDNSVSSRLLEMCHLITVQGRDRRIQ